MNASDDSSSLWDPSHDWILQFDRILKNRPSQNSYVLGKYINDGTLYMNGPLPN